jgi:hypothetical protein
MPAVRHAASGPNATSLTAECLSLRDAAVAVSSTDTIFVAVSPLLVMADRAAALRADPPVDWDGVYVKTTK